MNSIPFRILVFTILNHAQRFHPYRIIGRKKKKKEGRKKEKEDTSEMSLTGKSRLFAAFHFHISSSAEKGREEIRGERKRKKRARGIFFSQSFFLRLQTARQGGEERGGKKKKKGGGRKKRQKRKEPPDNATGLFCPHPDRY